MIQNTTQKQMIGRAEPVSFPEIGIETTAARIDTGAKTSSIWATASVDESGRLKVEFFAGDKETGGPFVHYYDDYQTIVVASSNGHSERRYRIQLLVVLAGRRIRAKFTLANRSTQVYPVLVGRNVLHRKFIVDVELGSPLVEKERQRSITLQSDNKGGIVK